MSGMVWAVYTTDDGRVFGLMIDSTRSDAAARGFSLSGVTGVNPFPRQWRPRRVVGIDPSGRIRYARVGSVSADLWTGVVTSFVVEANDGVDVQAAVIGRQQERTRQPH